MTKEQEKYLVQAIVDVIDSLRNYEIVETWNEYCENSNYYDDYIEYNNIDKLCVGCYPSEVLARIDIENYNENDEYAVNSIYGYRSFNYLDDNNSPVDVEEIALNIVNDMDDSAYSYIDLEEIMEELGITEEEEEEEE